MTPVEKMFKFPIRVFESEEKKDYVIGYKRVFIHDIKDIGDYSQLRELDGIKEKGFDSTCFSTYDGDEYVSSWKRERFEKEYDKHVQILNEIEKDDAEK